jgi:hypothetical protein
MTQAEQAVLLWPMLALAARTQQILSYAAVEGYTGIARYGLNRALGLIHDYCKRRGRPLLNTIVVSQQSGMPGEGFPEDLSPVEIKVEQGRVFLFDWSGHDKPRPDDFRLLPAQIEIRGATLSALASSMANKYRTQPSPCAPIRERVLTNQPRGSVIALVFCPGFPAVSLRRRPFGFCGSWHPFPVLGKQD